MTDQKLKLRCRNLFVGYDGKAVLGPIDFEVFSGDYLCIIGANGSGKTTLMKTLLGIIKPVSGTIETAVGTRRGAGYLPQKAEMQRDFPASVQEVVLSGFHSCMGLRPFYSKAEKHAASANLERLGMKGFEGRPYSRLSGGQQQRVLLARALCAAGDLLILDEPVAGLDPDATKEMYSTIEDLNRNSGMTIIMISHDIEAVSSYATKILKVGKDLFYGSAEQYRAHTEGDKDV